MAKSLYIAVNITNAGKITCVDSAGNRWFSYGNQTECSGFNSTSATFTAEAGYGYIFNRFVVYQNGAEFRSYYNNPSNLGFYADGIYGIMAEFVQAPTTYTCNIYQYLDGQYYNSFTRSGTQNEYLDLSGISAPYGAEFSSANFNGQYYSYIPPIILSSNSVLQIYYVTPKKIYTVSIITYKDGAVYTSNNYSYEEQSTFYVSSLTSAPSGYHLNYLTVNGYTHNTLSISIIVTNNIVIYVYYEADKIRPADWAWTTTIAQDSVIKLTAEEWNNFTSKINEFREYADLSANSFTIAKSGTPIKATICNEAYTAIDAISGHGTLPSKPASGDLLYASFFNDLKDALNAIK